MNRKEQLERLYKIQEEIRIVQESGLWQPLHDAKGDVIKLIKELESVELKKSDCPVCAKAGA